MADLFDIDFVIKNFGGTNLGYFLDRLKKATPLELRHFRRSVRQHQKHSKSSKAFSNTPWLTAHGAIIAAIDHEVLKRSPIRFRVWSAIFPVRKFLVSKFSGMDLERNERLGALYTTREYRKSAWHLTHRELMRMAWQFIVEHRKAIVGAIFTVIAAFVLKWLA